MAIFLVVKLVDVTDTPLGNASVQVTFNGTSSTPLSGVGAGIYETQIPDTASTVNLSVLHNNFFEVMQTFDVNRTTTPVTLKFTGDRHINVLYTAASSRGTSDTNEEVHITMGQLCDASQLVQTLANPNDPLGIGPTAIPHFNTPILLPNGSGANIFNNTPLPITPSANARVFFAERLTIPKLVAIVDPGWGNSISTTQFHYHLFFTPSIPWNPQDPFGEQDIHLISRYVFTIPFAAEGKRMAYQNIGALPKTIFVFPVSTNNNRGDIETQNGAFRLLQEVNFWVQRMQGLSYATHPLGQIFLSSFSNGTNSLESIFTSQRNSRFYDKKLQGVFIFDGVLNSGHYTSFATLLNNWHRNGAQNRSYRIYTQYHRWWEHMAPHIPQSSVLSPTPADTKEAQDPGRTLMWVSLAAWQRIDSTLNTDNVHQFIPARFMEHATSVSSIIR